MRTAWIGVGLAAAFSVHAAAGADDGNPGYVNPAVCAGCHAEIARNYALTGMGRSIARPRPENQIEDYQTRNTLYHPASDRYYTMLRRDGKVYQRRHQIGFGGSETNVVEEQADYVIGSGNHVRSYLRRTPQGKLAELPVSWYAENGGYWAMSPGYDTPDHLDFRRTVSYECIFCHAAYPMPGSNFAAFAADDSIFGDTPLESIDCQRCHGPGRAHVEAARGAAQSRESVRRAILNPARLSRDRQLDVCMQCHLETTTSFPIASIRRYNREPFSFRPGEPLGDFALFFDQAPGASRALSAQSAKFEFVHAAYGLRKSACFRASQMTCTTCHSPHQVPERAQAVAHYVSACLGCHAGAHASGVPNAAPNAASGAASIARPNGLAESHCLGCHMPKRRTDDVVHAVMTDHHIQRRKAPGDLLAPRRESHRAYDGLVAPYYPARAAPAPGAAGNELYLAVAQVRYSTNLSYGIPRLQRAIETQHPERPEFYFELGVACWKAGRKEDAIRWYEEALRHGGYRPALKALGEALLDTGQLTRAARVLKGVALEQTSGSTSSTSISPDADVLYALGSLYFRQNNLDQAAHIINQALTVNPDLQQARNLQGVVQGRKGNKTAAADAFHDAIRVQPDFDLPHINLALLLAADGDFAQAGYHLKKAIASNPGSVEAHHTYGLVLLRSGAYEQALLELQETVRLAPNLAEAHADLADVLARQGRLQESAEHHRRALDLKPELKPAAPARH